MNSVDTRETLIVQNLMAGDSAKIALEKAGYAESTVKNNSTHIISRPGIQSKLKLALEKAGITVDKIAQVAADGLDANRPVVVDKSLVDYPDHGIRHKYLETVVKLSGLEPAQSVSIDADTYEARILAIASRSQAIDIPSIADSCNNSNTIITAELVENSAELNDKCITGDYKDSDCGGGI